MGLIQNQYLNKKGSVDQASKAHFEMIYRSTFNQLPNFLDTQKMKR